MTRTTQKILVVDDDARLRDLLRRYLGENGYSVFVAENAQAMNRLWQRERYDLLILDLMMPGEDGLSLCRDLRARSQIPVIMLTMLGEETDRILGLEMGADDYLPKPFNPRELLARLKAVLRRSKGPAATAGGGANTVLGFAGWRLNRGLRRLESPDRLVIDLSTGEFDLLAVFAEHPQQVLTRDQLLDFTQGRSEAPFDRSIDMQVSRLRHKIEANSKDPELIKTVRGGGYVFTAGVTQDGTADT